MPDEIRDEAARLFHDTRLSDIDPVAHEDFLIARVLDRGTMRSVRALVRAVGLPRIRAFFESRAVRQVTRPTIALWCAYLGLDERQCISRRSPPGSPTFWPG
jgi:hypothetical protein